MDLAILKGNGNDVIVNCVPFAIGRCRTANFIIPHVNISRNHCQIVLEDSSWKILDYSSSGTHVNGQLIGKNGVRLLKNGDIVTLGEEKNKFSWIFYALNFRNEAKSDVGQNFTLLEGQAVKNTEELMHQTTHIQNNVGVNEEECRDSECAQVPINEGAECKGNECENSLAKCCDDKETKLLTELREMKNELCELKCKNISLIDELTAANNKRNAESEIKSNVLQNFTDLIETELQCTICSELFVSAVTLGCTHSFCQFCLNQWKSKQKTCPICRKKIVIETKSLVLDNYIDKMVEQLSAELKERRENIIKERKEVLPPTKKSRSRKTVF